MTSTQEEKFMTREEVASHNTSKNLWTIINNTVYDLSQFQNIHPGGKKVIEENAGKDASEPWILVGHSPKAEKQMEKYVVGKIDPNEEVNTENPMHKSVMGKYFPYLSFIAFIAFLYVVALHEDLHYDKPSEYIGLCLGAAPSFALICSAMRLWPGKHFKFHRIGGLCFLIQYAVAWYYYFKDYHWYKESFLVWSVPLNGVSQAITAIVEVGPNLEPKDKGDFFGNRGTMTLDFVKENLFYQLTTFFGTLYYHHKYVTAWRSTVPGLVFEVIFVFLPYVVVRPFFPKTSLRDALYSKDNKSQDHKHFYIGATILAKVFVLLAKHYLGIMINAIVFLGGLSDPEALKLLHFNVLANAGTISIGIFTHTLRYKNILPPKMAMTIYQLYLYVPAIFVIQIIPRLFPYWKIFSLCTVSLVLNLLHFRSFQVWSCIMTIPFVLYRFAGVVEMRQLIL